MEIDNFRNLAFPSGAVAVANTAWIAFLFARSANFQKHGTKLEFIHSFNL